MALQLNVVGSRSVPWKDALPEGVSGSEVIFGRDDAGVGAVQIAVASATVRPTKGTLTAMWKTRGQNVAMPVIVAAVAPEGVWLHGPDEKEDPAGPVSIKQAERLLQSVLDEPNGIAAHTQIRAIRNHLGTVGGTGFVNHFLFATYHLRTDVPRRADWAAARERAASLLSRRGKDLIEALGFTTDSAPGGALVLRAASGSRRAIAVLLDESENFDQKSAKYQLSPVAHGLEVAGREEVPWVIVMRKDTLRLYPGRDGIGVGQRGQSETYFELDLAFLDEEFAGLLPLIFSADALEKDGTADQILTGSGKYAADLGTRLRDRVYEGVVPVLAAAIAERLPSVGLAVDADGLRTAYALTMRILFRLLFQAYGESSELLPVENDNYRANSLQRFVASIDEKTEFDENASSIWLDLVQVWDAIANGNKQWGIPAYGGSLFDQSSAEGELIEKLKLPDSVTGPALRAMLTERTEDGVLGAVDFRSLQVREFGTIYEGLLESSLSLAEGDLTLDRNGAFVPAKEGDAVVARAGEPYFHSASGERKSTGSYYTPKIVVDHLIDRSIVPAIEKHLDRVRELMESGREREAADLFFDFRVADLAMGSAHFLVAAVDKIERYMRDFLTVTPVPGVRAELQRLAESAQRALNEVSIAEIEINEAQLLRRQVARRCVYGLDINPLAVELSQLAIWIHTFVPGLPMASLDHNLVLANSLTGIGTVDEAIEALAVGDLLAPLIKEPLDAARDLLIDYANASEADKAEVARGAEVLAQARQAAAPAKAVFDVAVAMRLGIVKPGSAFTQDDIDELARDPRVAEAVDPLLPAHMPYLFPEVFLRGNGGFDVLLGNPPWEKVKIEEHQWWGMRIPKLRSMPQKEKNAALAAFRAGRPDLEAQYAADLAATDGYRAVIVRGPYPGIGSGGDPDLYQAFAWRFWRLVRETGRAALVLPRGALSGSALAEWRRQVLDEGAFADVCLLMNSGNWIFSNVDGRYTVGLTVIERGTSHVARFCGPFSSEAEFLRGADDVAEVEATEFLSWASTAAFPLIPDAKSAEVFAQMKRSPRFDEARPGWEFRPIAELHATGDKDKFEFDTDEPRGRIPVLAGASFNIWNPDFGKPYAYAKPEVLRPALTQKLERAIGNARSAYYRMAFGDGELPMDRARIAFRDIARATDTRTTLAVLLPPGAAVVHNAPVLVARQGDARAEAFLLGVMCSMPFDWGARRWVELHLTFDVLSALPVPHYDSRSTYAARVAESAARLAAVDERFAVWASEVGVEVGTVGNDAVKADLIAELDALVALLYGLTADQVEHVFATFHRGWDYRARLDAVLEHYNRWKEHA
ncbi:MAG: hypothetical protein EAS51_00085 [Microbacteriaceae bacterium]|nr:MAG: hypothetical protein EAS51_00085 [Microbacteriaceae bacterium]